MKREGRIQVYFTDEELGIVEGAKAGDQPTANNSQYLRDIVLRECKRKLGEAR